MGRSKGDMFEVQWEAEDGYCGGSRPQSFYIHLDEIDEGMDEQDLEHLFYDLLEQDFMQRVSPVSNDCQNFIAWAQKQQQKMREDEHDDATVS